MKKFLLFSGLFGTLLTGWAQPALRHCGFDFVKQQLLLNHPEYKEKRDAIEAFTAAYVERMSHEKRERGTVYKIPVVVHVIHNGEAIGSGANLSATQINSQIAVLNKDYRLKNTDSLTTSHAYHPYVADCEIEFCLATLDPQGHLTTGIDRFNYSMAMYDYPDLENTIKPNTIWDAEKYLNIWTCMFGGSISSLLGYTTPPGSPLDIDGVVISATSFGNTGNVVAPYNKGRTATHEIGHYFNLIHVWGDDGTACTGSDLVSDTPNQAGENYGCPTFPSVSCGNGPNGDMFMNYMDYTDDACMKMFTQGQKTRMRASLTTGGSRSTLTTSLGCTWPTGLQETAKEWTITAFPNPTHGVLYLKAGSDFNTDISFHLFNALGQEFSNLVTWTKEAGNQYAAHTGSLPDGNYFLQVSSNGQRITKSITVINE